MWELKNVCRSRKLFKKFRLFKGLKMIRDKQKRWSVLRLKVRKEKMCAKQKEYKVNKQPAKNFRLQIIKGKKDKESGAENTASHVEILCCR